MSKQDKNIKKFMAIDKEEYMVAEDDPIISYGQWCVDNHGQLLRVLNYTGVLGELNLEFVPIINDEDGINVKGGLGRKENLVRKAYDEEICQLLLKGFKTAGLEMGDVIYNAWDGREETICNFIATYYPKIDMLKLGSTVVYCDGRVCLAKRDELGNKVNKNN